jgi:hypothetical protein
MNYTTTKLVLSCLFRYKNTSHSASLLTCQLLTSLNLLQLICNDASSIWSYIVTNGLSQTASWSLKLIYDWQSVGQSVLVSGSHLEPMTSFNLSLLRLRVSWYGAPSLTRGWVCNLLVQLFLGLGSKYRRTLGHILLSHLRLHQPGGPDPRIYILQEQCGPVIPPGTGFPFCRPLRLAGLQWRYSNPPPHGSGQSVKVKVKVKVKVGQSVLALAAHLGPATSFSFS